MEAKLYEEEQNERKKERITDGLPVFWFMDGEDDSWRGGLLLDGGQEGKLTFSPEELHHSLRDVCRRMDGSPNIWGERSKMGGNRETSETPDWWCIWN